MAKKKQCGIMSHLKVAYGSWSWSEENPWPPWSAVIKSPLWVDPKYERLRNRLQRPVAKPVFEKPDAGLVSIQFATYTQLESGTGKLIVEAGRVEVLAMCCGSPIPSIISSLPFAARAIEVHGLYTIGLHNVVARLLLSGVPVFIAGEGADVRADVAALKTTGTHDMYPCDVSIYNLSSKTPLYTSSTHLLSICSSAPFEKKLPQYVAYREGAMSSVMPVEIFSYLLNMSLVLQETGFCLGLCLCILRECFLPVLSVAVMLCWPCLAKSLLCLMSLFSPRERLSPMLTLVPPSPGMMLFMT